MWRLSHSADPTALAVVDGLGRWAGHGSHYSRRTPGSRSFVGVGQEIVLVTDAEDAVWSVVRHRTPSRRGTGQSRGRTHQPDSRPTYVWRNNMFRNLGRTLSSMLIVEAVRQTYLHWSHRYGGLPLERLRTEVDPRAVRSKNPGYCYRVAGWHNRRMVRGKLHLDAPCPTLVAGVECACCPGSALRGKP